MAAPIRHLFTYGTLAPGSTVPAARALATAATVVGPATVAGRLFAGPGWPAWDAAGEGPVHGTLWRLTDADVARDALLATLDAYEGVVPGDAAASLFVRETAPATPVAGVGAPSGTVRAWIYRYAQPVEALRPITSGRWPGR